MQTIIIVLDAKKLKNPNLDIRYALPDRIEEYSNSLIRDNGYDYLSGTALGIWLETNDSLKNADMIIQLLKSERFLDNDLSGTAEIYISEEECAEFEKCRKIYPL